MRQATLLIAVWAVAGCEGGTDRPPTVSRTDSAGVEIIRLDLPLASPAAERWELGQPILKIGALDGHGPEILEGIREILTLPGDRFAILNQGVDVDVRVFDLHGDHLVTLGRRGPGPGELLEPFGASYAAGDTIVVYDLSASKLELFPIQGGRARTVPVRVPLGAPWIHVPNGSRTVFLADRAGPFLSPDLERGFIFTPLVGVSLDDGGVDTIARLPLMEAKVIGGFPDALRFGGRGRLLRVDSSFVWAESGSGEIRFWDASGELSQIVRFQNSRIPVSREDIRQFRESQAEALRNVVAPDGLLENAREREAFSDSFPRIGGVRESPGGGFLVYKVTRPRSESPTRVVHRFDRDWNWLGAIQLDAGWMALLSDTIVARAESDSLGVPYVVLYRLGTSH